jgi:hypothetical protein
MDGAALLGGFCAAGRMAVIGCIGVLDGAWYGGFAFVERKGRGCARHRTVRRSSLFYAPLGPGELLARLQRAGRSPLRRANAVSGQRT